MLLDHNIRNNFLRRGYLVLDSFNPRNFQSFLHDCEVEHFNPPFLLSPMIVLLLIFAGLPSQMKLKVILFICSTYCLGTFKTEALYISFDRPSVLTMLIFP